MHGSAGQGLMTVTRETDSLEGTLTGEGRQRTCRVRVSKHATYDECAKPVCVSYSRFQIEDEDDFPDGDYELSCSGLQLRLRKEAGHYTTIPMSN